MKKAEEVKEFYADVIKSGGELKVNLCGVNSPEYDFVHEEIKKTHFGCGIPIPELIEGKTVLDVGCGTGRDAYLLSKLVGEKGKVYGVDINDESLKIANKHVDYHMSILGYSKPNITFFKGYIEDLEAAGVPTGSVDVVISNCVINLAASKTTVFKSIYNVLKEGGEIMMSDNYTNKELSEELREDRVLWSECVSGALSLDKFDKITKEIGFSRYYTISASKRELKSELLNEKAEGYKLISLTTRQFKIASGGKWDDSEEDYGQEVTFNGDKDFFKFAEGVVFYKGGPKSVSRNVARILKSSFLKEYFSVSAEKEHAGKHITNVARDYFFEEESCCNCGCSCDS